MLIILQAYLVYKTSQNSSSLNLGLPGRSKIGPGGLIGPFGLFCSPGLFCPPGFSGPEFDPGFCGPTGMHSPLTIFVAPEDLA